MNKHIKQLINAFNPSEIFDTNGADLTGSDTVEDFIYRYKYFPKTNLELADCVKKLLDAGETNLNVINTSKIKDFSKIFIGQFPANRGVVNLDIRFWDVSNGENFNQMFFNCSKLITDLSQWDVSNGKTFNAMFYNCSMFNSDLSNWDMHNAVDVSNMFLNCQSFNSDLSNWDVSNVEDFRYMLAGCTNFVPCFEDWDIRSGKHNTDKMFIRIDKFGIEAAIEFAFKWGLDLDKFYVVQTSNPFRFN